MNGGSGGGGVDDLQDMFGDRLVIDTELLKDSCVGTCHAVTVAHRLCRLLYEC